MAKGKEKGLGSGRLGSKENPVVIEEGIYILDEPSTYEDVRSRYGWMWAVVLALAIGGSITVVVTP